MTKSEFLSQLGGLLSGLQKDEIEERLGFYSEMIDDKIEDGLSEAEAIEQIGTPREVAEQIIRDTPLGEIVRERIKPARRIKPLEITLLVLGAPIWLSLLVAVLAVGLSLYAVLWSLVVAAWAVFASVAACAPAGVAAGIAFIFRAAPTAGLAMIGAGILLCGLAVFLFFGCRAATLGVIWLTKKIMFSIKLLLLRKDRKG